MPQGETRGDSLAEYCNIGIDQVNEAFNQGIDTAVKHLSNLNLFSSANPMQPNERSVDGYEEPLGTGYDLGAEKSPISGPQTSNGISNIGEGSTSGSPAELPIGTDLSSIESINNNAMSTQPLDPAPNAEPSTTSQLITESPLTTNYADLDRKIVTTSSIDEAIETATQSTNPLHETALATTYTDLVDRGSTVESNPASTRITEPVLTANQPIERPMGSTTTDRVIARVESNPVTTRITEPILAANQSEVEKPVSTSYSDIHEQAFKTPRVAESPDVNPSIASNENIQSKEDRKSVV